jgi:DNA-binding transcriptional MocR family regulator
MQLRNTGEDMESFTTLQARYDAYKKMGLQLNMQRGQPADANFDLANPMLTIVDEDDVVTPSGIAIRNYPGGVAGLPEARELFAEVLGVRPAEMIVGNNASMMLMSQTLMWAMLRGLKDSPAPWKNGPARMIVTVPGYDRHFHLLAELGIEMVSVPMTGDGPDVTAVSQLAASDPAIKGIFFVPVYSNPTGDTISDEAVKTLAAMPTAAPDFTILADNAYAVHHLTQEQERPLNLLRACEAAGNPGPRLLVWLHLQNHLCQRRYRLHGQQRGQRRLPDPADGSRFHWPQQGGTIPARQILAAYPGGLRGSDA